MIIKNEKLKNFIEKFDTNKKIEKDLNLYYSSYEEIRNEMFYDRFPGMFGKHTFDFSISFGWFSVLEQFCEKVEKLSPSKNLIKIVQVKEKFGDLRLYFDLKTKDENIRKSIQELLTEAEIICDTLCETCGLPGKKYTDGWHRIRCDKHK